MTRSDEYCEHLRSLITRLADEFDGRYDPNVDRAEHLRTLIIDVADDCNRRHGTDDVLALLLLGTPLDELSVPELEEFLFYRLIDEVVHQRRTCRPG